MDKFLSNKITRTVFWLFAILLWTAVSVIAAQLLVGMSMLTLLGKEEFSEPMPTAICSALSYVIAMLLIIFVPPLLKKSWRNNHSAKSSKNKSTKENIACKFVTREEIGLRGWPTWTDIGLAPVGYIVYLIIGMAITFLFNLFPWFDANQAQDVGFSTYMTSGDRIIAFITLVVIAPIAEEIIFRGWLYGKIRNRLSVVTTNVGSMIVSALLVSILFGAIHMQWNVGVNVFALSLVLCALREITGTIYSGILLHMLKNGIAFYLLYVIGVS